MNWSNNTLSYKWLHVWLCLIILDGVEELDNNFILDSLQQAKKLVDAAYKHTRQVYVPLFTTANFENVLIN